MAQSIKSPLSHSHVELPIPRLSRLEEVDERLLAAARLTLQNVGPPLENGLVLDAWTFETINGPLYTNSVEHVFLVAVDRVNACLLGEMPDMEPLTSVCIQVIPGAGVEGSPYSVEAYLKLADAVEYAHKN